jgi:hypothetical protein
MYQRFRLIMAALLLLVIGGVLSGANSGVSLAAAPTGALWHDVNAANIAPAGARQIIPSKYRTVAVDEAALVNILAQASAESATNSPKTSGAVITLPLPDGSYGRFSFVNSPIMAASLAARYPQIQTFMGQGIDDATASVRFDRTQFGFHAMILAAGGTVFIDPYQQNDTTNYISYFKSDSQGAPLNELGVVGTAPQDDYSNVPLIPSGTELRTYRLALAADGEYTQFYGGTVAGALAGMVTSMNRVDGVYEREVAVRMVMVANEEDIIYTDPTTDPYTNNDGGTMLGENQANLDAVTGSANYDIGHVFSTGGGGIAGLGVVCLVASKAEGVTGSSSPIGDNFDIDYVAHEMGHQYGADHTFNGTTSNCGGGNRSGSHAYEPASGSTIMAYAGICGAEDLQPHSDPYFHTDSFDAIVSYTTVGAGDACAVTTSTGNTPPVVDAGAAYTIPMHTPFKLTGSATDADDDPLTYNWEEFDRGAAAPPNTDNGNRPIFRSFNAATVPYRYLPKLSDILANTLTFGEAWPTTDRTMTFRLTARDDRAGGGGVDHDSTTVTSVTSAGPFIVTQPDTAVTWNGGDTETVTWDVANTAAAPVSCANVNITLSVDGGATFSTTLAGGTANDGTEDITVPNADTTTARVMVACSDNIFFDISNADFTIVGGPTATPTTGATDTPAPPTDTPAPPTNTPGGPTVTPTVCTLSFEDVPVGSTFYPYIQCLACRGIINGYPCGGDGEPCNANDDPYFRPGNNVTRGQFAKIASNAAGFDETPGAQQYEDVAVGSTFFDSVWRLSDRGYINGYPCGGPGEPCGPDSLPYFRPNANVTRGQLSKIDANAAGFDETPGAQQYEDVVPGSTFFDYIWRLSDREIINGYPCGGTGEPCGPNSLPYFRPGANATRGQASKIVSNTFFPECAITGGIK